MKSTGITRQLDQLGRIVFPIELRRTLHVDIGDPLEIFIDEESKQIMLRKYRSQECLFCGSIERLIYFRAKFICASCLAEFNAAYGYEVSEPEVAVTLEVVDEGSDFVLHETTRKRGRKEKVSWEDLVKVMEANPDASQREWAQQLGISQGRVSQIIRKHR